MERVVLPQGRRLGRRSILPYVDNAAYYKVAVSAVDPQHVPSSLLKRYPKKCRGAAAFFSPRPQSSSRCTPQHPNQHFDTLQSPGTSRKDALACGPVPPLASQGGQQLRNVASFLQPCFLKRVRNASCRCRSCRMEPMHAFLGGGNRAYERSNSS